MGSSAVSLFAVERANVDRGQLLGAQLPVRSGPGRLVLTPVTDPGYMSRKI